MPTALQPSPCARQSSTAKRTVDRTSTHTAPLNRWATACPELVLAVAQLISQSISKPLPAWRDWICWRAPVSEATIVGEVVAVRLKVDAVPGARQGVNRSNALVPAAVGEL